MKYNKIVLVIFSVLTALLAPLIVSTGLLYPTAAYVNDILYQREEVPAEEIVLIGIDQEALNTIGPWPWSRTYIAEAIAYLNEDEETRPAVIGIDSVYAGYSSDAEADAMLAEVAAQNDNLVFASMATFGDELIINDDGTFYMDDYAILGYDEPYPELSENTTVGHVNAMLDEDGVLRHAVWQLDLNDGREIPSFHQEIYKKYMEYIGEDEIVTPHLDARHRWYVPMSSGPFALDDGFSVSDLISHELDPNFFAGKIVLIGPYAAGLQDSYPTAIDHTEAMYGVEFQANAIAALVDGNVKQEILDFPQMVALFIVVLASLLWFYDRSMLSVFISWVLVCVLYVALCYFANLAGYIIYVLYIPLFVTIAFIISVASNYVRAALERRKITNTFRRYVAPEIVSELLKGDPETLGLGGKLTDIAVLFVDIRGFTPLSESLDPPTVVEIINSYLTLTSDCIFKNNGTLDKYIGDCTMAFWGAPIPQEDPIWGAVKAAIDMVEGAEKIGNEIFEKHGKTVHFGVGVNYGPAVVGNIGSVSRMDYTAIGDTVNTAARLESNAPAGQIYVSRVVADALSDRVNFTSLGTDIKLKGKSENFEILRVDNLK